MLGSRSTQALGSILNVIGIAFGIWEVVESVDQIQNGSDLAKKFKKVEDEVSKVFQDLIEMNEVMIEMDEVIHTNFRSESVAELT